jgi:hypothetical protein
MYFAIKGKFEITLNLKQKPLPYYFKAFFTKLLLMSVRKRIFAPRNLRRDSSVG